ncbi:MAG: DUF882 domain-containing protein [Sandaracinaceae bacterium]|nr:DUF882 domain-containing protein [Sandaracinaceae bacterium]
MWVFISQCMSRSHPWVFALAALGIPGLAVADAPVTTVFFTSDAPTGTCPPAVIVRRQMGDGDEELVGPLLDCDGLPRPEALRDLSVLARPRGLPAPSPEALEAFDAGSNPGFVAEGIRELHPELLDRLQRLRAALDGRPIEIVSGYRPESAATSRHHHGRALDLRVQGVEREQVRDVLAGFDRSGVGWYPNSTFVHLDVRDRFTYWVDESAPGEPPRYVRGAVPPTPPTADSPIAVPPAPTIDLDSLRATLGAIRIEPIESP